MNVKCQYWPGSVDLFIIFRGQASFDAQVLMYRPKISSSRFVRYRIVRGQRCIVVFDLLPIVSFPLISLPNTLDCKLISTAVVRVFEKP